MFMSTSPLAKIYARGKNAGSETGRFGVAITEAKTRQNKNLVGFFTLLRDLRRVFKAFWAAAKSYASLCSHVM